MVDVVDRDEFNALAARVTALEKAGPGTTPTPPPSKVDNDFVDTNKWRLTFRDEFDNGMNDTIWKHDFYFGDRVLNSNHERQYYMDKDYKGDGSYHNGEALGVNPFVFRSPSILSIEAKISDPEKSAHYWGYPFTSGLITTEKSFSQTYGMFVMRARMPAGKGLWPAFWLLGSDKNWPPELDPVEFFGAPNSRGEGGPSKFHWGLLAPDRTKDKGAWYETGADLTKDFHVYGMEWNDQKIIYYFDGVVVSTVETPAGVDKPMYILVNLAVGGDWPELPDSATRFPAYLDIDFVRAYQRK